MVYFCIHSMKVAIAIGVLAVLFALSQGTFNKYEVKGDDSDDSDDDSGNKVGWFGKFSKVRSLSRFYQKGNWYNDPCLFSSTIL